MRFCKGSRAEPSARNSRKKSGLNLQKRSMTYELVKPGDKIAVCISGGKDSMLMAKLFPGIEAYTTSLILKWNFL